MLAEKKKKKIETNFYLEEFQDKLIKKKKKKNYHPQHLNWCRIGSNWFASPWAQQDLKKYLSCC